MRDLIEESRAARFCQFANSFAPGTNIAMADGTTKPIDQVKTGDQVITTDPNTGNTTSKTVTATHINNDTDLADITVRDGQGSHTIHTTQNHPFWDATTGTWTPAAGLRPGETLVTPDRTSVTVLKIETFDTAQDMYNLTVADIHTYYVVAGTTPVLVHNCGTTPNNSPGTLADELSAAEAAGVKPLRAGSAEFNDAVAGGGRYIWSVSEDGTLNMAPWGENISHPILNGGAPVRGAGEVVFGRGGVVTDINNVTGHYTPTCRCGADLQAGVDAFTNAGVPVLRSAINPFGW
jgi:hypothetical protein